MALKVCQLCAVDFTLKHFLLPLIERMNKEGWSVTAVCSDGPSVKDLREQGYHIEVIYIERSFNLIQHIKSILALTRFFKDKKFDVVHVHTPIAALLARIAAWLASVPLVIYTSHGFYFHDEMTPLKRAIFLFLEKFAGRFTDILFTQSAEDAALARQENLQPKGRIYNISNGVDTKKFNPNKIKNQKKIRKSLGIKDSAFVIGMVARLVKEKGICEFVEAAIQSSSKNNNLCFILVGERLSSDHAKEVTKILEEAKEKLGRRILFLGQRSDIPELMSVMNVFCLPSWREGMPRTIIEAMMMGKPVIATNIRGSREEVVEGKTGFLVPTRNATLLNEKFLYCIKNIEQVKKMGEAARIRALECFDEKNVIDTQINLIKFIISKG